MSDQKSELLDVIERTIDAHPRSLQKRIGPSEIGTPCTRKLGHRLAHTPEIAHRLPAWRPTVGTATHTWLTAAYDRDNARYSPGEPRWVTSLRVPVGEIDGEEIDGELDLYDVYTGTVIDWKVPGPTSLKNKKRAADPGPEYRIQVHLYGRGLRRWEIVPQHVGILFLPSNGELADSYYWTEPYDEQIAIDALERASGIAMALRMIGPDVLGGLATSPDYCSYCPWFVPGSTDLGAACPGDPSLFAKPMAMSDLIQPATTPAS